MDYEFGWDFDNGCLVLRGELDEHALAHHEVALLAGISGSIVIDASGLGFVSSRGLRLLLRLAGDNGGSVEIHGAQVALRRLVAITGTGEQLVIVG